MHILRLLYIGWVVGVLLFAPWGEIRAQGSKKNTVVVIDPGHGGKDTGKEASSDKYLDEKALNLLISQKLGNYIKEKLPEVTVIYTRDKDTFLSLEDRMELANGYKADYFISIHCNSNPDKSVYGTTTHIHRHDLLESKALALHIENEFATRASRKSRGIMDVKQRGHNLYVLQFARMPAVLVECGFISNADEERYLNSDDGQSIIASAIFRAFRTFIQENHPKEDRSKVFRVQVLASEVPVATNDARFKPLDMKVVEMQDEKASKYKYKYAVGQEYTLEDANDLLKKVQKAGFKDAFVITAQ